MEESRELAWRIEPLRSEIAPALFLKDPAVKLVIPEHVQGLALGVIIRAGKSDNGRSAGRRRLNDLLNQSSSGPDLD